MFVVMVDGLILIATAALLVCCFATVAFEFVGVLECALRSRCASHVVRHGCMCFCLLCDSGEFYGVVCDTM